MDWVSGLSEIETKCAGTTVSTELSLNEPTVAVIVVEPAANVVASPELPMVATEVEDELQDTPPLKSELVPSV
jgi:hypothetical protein